MTKQELLKFICDMYGISTCTEIILKQINKYVTERGYKYIEIARALSYFVDVQGNKPEIKYGIAIVPFVMEESRKYFEELKRQKEEQLRAVEASKSKDIIVIHCKIRNDKTIKKKKIDINNI